jgi:prepilin-type N-terminal cleavage/methylation domain-containing protein
MKKNTHTNRTQSNGFTLIELLLYIGIVSILLTGAIMFAWDVIYGRVKSSIQREVGSNIRLASERIGYEIRNAYSINLASGSTLSLAVSDTNRNPTVFSLSNGRLMIGYGASGPCPTSNPCALTSNLVNVSELIFTDQSSGSDSYNIKYNISIESTTARSQWQHNQSYRGSVELRSN